MADETKVPAGDTPEAPKAPEAEDLAKKLAETERRAQELEARYKDAERKITEVTTRESTLAQRMAEVEQQRVDKQEAAVSEQEAKEYIQRASEVLRESNMDPNAAAEKMAKLMIDTKIRAEKAAIGKIGSNIDSFVEYKLHIKEVESKNPDLAPFRDLISLRVNDIMSKNKNSDVKEAINKAVSEFRSIKGEPVTKVDPTPKPSTTAPTAPVGETGSPKVTAPSDPDKELTKEEVDRAYLESRVNRHAGIINNVK